MRNEAPYLLEWLAYHHVIGFEHFLIVSNDCDDGTYAMLDRLAEMGWVTHLRNQDYAKKGVQWTALDMAGKNPVARAAEWHFIHDCDEFLNIKPGTGNLSDLLEAQPAADGFALPWRLFGNAGVVTLEDALTLEQFTRCAPEHITAPWTASLIKTLYRNDGTFEKLGVHRPKKPGAIEDVTWMDGKGAILPEIFIQQGMVLLGSHGGQSLACVNHYSLRSAHGFFAKAERGLPNVASKPIDLGYWIDRNFNGEEETSIQRHIPEVSAVWNDLKSDPVLGQLHAEGIAYHQSRAKAALQTQEGVIQLVRMLTSQSVPIPDRLGYELTDALRQINQRNTS